MPPSKAICAAAASPGFSMSFFENTASRTWRTFSTRSSVVGPTSTRPGYIRATRERSPRHLAFVVLPRLRVSVCPASSASLSTPAPRRFATACASFSRFGLAGASQASLIRS